MVIPDNLADKIQVQECSSIRFAMQSIIELHKNNTSMAEAAILIIHIEALANIMKVCMFLLDENCNLEKT